MKSKTSKRILSIIGVVAVLLVGIVLSRDLWMPQVMPLLYIGEALYGTVQKMEEELENRIEEKDFRELLETEEVQQEFVLHINQLNGEKLYNPLQINAQLRSIPGEHSIGIVLNQNQTVALNAYVAGDEIGVNIPSVGKDYWTVRGSQFAQDFNASPLRKILFMDEIGESFNWQGLQSETNRQDEAQEEFIEQLIRRYMSQIEVEQQESQLAYGAECRVFQIRLDEANTKALVLDIVDYATQQVDLQATQEVALLTEQIDLESTTDTLQQSVVEMSQKIDNLRNSIENSHYGEGIVLDILIDPRGTVREIMGRLEVQTAQNEQLQYEGSVAFVGEQLLTDALNLRVQLIKDQERLLHINGQLGLIDGKEEIVVDIQNLDLEVTHEGTQYRVGLDGEVITQTIDIETLKPDQTKEILKMTFQEYQEVLGGLIRWFFNLRRLTS